MKAIELKFVLKLLGQEGYRAPISKLNPSDKTTTSERGKICRELADRGIVDYSREISQFKIEPAGTALLKQDITQLPVSEQQILVLQACANKDFIIPSKVTKIPTVERQAVIQDLEAKGLIKATKDQIKEVWLTEQGKEYLREDCNPSGTALISLNLLQNYLSFLRRTLRATSTIESHTSEISSSVSISSHKPSDKEVLQTIKELDQKLGTNNYLPIFHLRQQLQPPFSRDELDQILYQLQRQDIIELSTLQEGHRYESEQIAAGISQPVGGPLFFIEIL